MQIVLPFLEVFIWKVLNILGDGSLQATLDVVKEMATPSMSSLLMCFVCSNAWCPYPSLPCVLLSISSIGIVVSATLKKGKIDMIVSRLCLVRRFIARKLGCNLDD